MVAQEFRSGLWVKDDSNFVNVGEVTARREPEAHQDLRVRRRAPAADDQPRRRSGIYVKRSQLAPRKVSRTDVRRTRRRSCGEIERRSNGTRCSTRNCCRCAHEKPERMSAWRLYSYSQHLRENRQKALRYEIALWVKIMYPIAVLVMMVIALPVRVTSRSGRAASARDLHRHHARSRVPHAEPPVLAPRPAVRLAACRCGDHTDADFSPVAVGMMWSQEQVDRSTGFPPAGREKLPSGSTSAQRKPGRARQVRRGDRRSAALHASA